MANYLIHHGIKGQSWGVRNGPPYPLNAQTHNKVVKGQTKGKPKVSNKQGVVTEAVIATVAPYMITAVAALSAYAIDKGAKAIRSKSMTKAMKQKLDVKRSDEEIDEKTGLHLKKEGDTSDDVKEVNPKFSEKHNAGATMNCVRCTFAYELRNRGYDCSAGLTMDGVNGIKETNRLFKNVKNVEIIPLPKKSKEISELQNKALSEKGNTALAKKTLDTLSKQPDSRGQILVSWAFGGGHSMAYDVKGGKVRIIDAQSGDIFEGDKASDILARSIYTQFQRLDNLEMNYDKAGKYVI